MGNTTSSPPSSSRRGRSMSPETAAERAKKFVANFQSTVQSSVKKFEDDHPAANFIDSMCGPFFDDDKVRSQRTNSDAYSEDYSDDDSRTMSEEDTLDEYDRRRRRKKAAQQSESSSMLSQSDYESEQSKLAARNRRDANESRSFDSEEEAYGAKKKQEKSVVTDNTSDVGPGQLSKPLASSFAKRCYFTKAGIGKTTQHYEGLTLTGNVVLMLAAAMKLKGCPTICDEDLRRVEQTYPNQFSRLPDELLLSSGWRRISKYCHFSNKPVPDGVPFFHSKQRCHPNGGYYFLLAAAVGMIRPIDVEPLTRDTLVLLETDFPTQCDAAPKELIHDPTEWTLVDKFCFFSGGPINTEEDVYYEADFDGNPIYMLAFLSPSLTPDELYKLNNDESDEPFLKSVVAVEEVESVYDLTERDFDDLRLYHLGPCRALPPYILQPQAWRKVLPPHFLAARHNAMMKAQQWEEAHGIVSRPPAPMPSMPSEPSFQQLPAQEAPFQFSSPMGSSATGQFLSQDWGQSQAQAVSVANNSQPGYYTQASSDTMQPQFTPRHHHTAFNPPIGSQQPIPPPQEPVPSVPGDYPFYGQPSPVPAVHSSTQLNAPSTHSSTHLSATHSSPQHNIGSPSVQQTFQREIEEEGAFVDSSVPIDEAIALRQMTLNPPASPSPSGHAPLSSAGFQSQQGLEPTGTEIPDDQPPSLSKRGEDGEVPDDEKYRTGSPYPEKADPPTFSQNSYPSPIDPPQFQQAYSEMDQVESTSQGEEYYPEESEFYETPSKEPQDSEEYYTREAEYYDSPENALGDFQLKNGHYLEPADAKIHNDSRSFESPKNSESSNPAYSGGEEDYYTSPGFREESTAVSEPSLEQGDGFVSVGDDKSSVLLNGSPPSEVSRGTTEGSDYTPTSAMRSAQDLLRKNRQKRMEMALRRQQQQNDDESQGTWDSASEMTSVISGSSVWTDGSNAADRSSRRALILQMAKARMKLNKSSNSVNTEGKRTPLAGDASRGMMLDHDETKSEVKTDIDFAGELD